MQVPGVRICTTLNTVLNCENAAECPIIPLAIIEDQKETREGLALLINATERFECRHVYSSMEDALAGIGSAPPRVALVDIGRPGINCIAGV